jgi:hypothetical protein
MTTIGHAYADDVQGIPEAAVKYHVAGVPDPLETERETYLSPP